MAENAYSCKTNFIILPLHRPPRFAFRLPLPLLLRFIYFIVRQRFTRTMNLRLLAYFRFALSNGGQLQISLTNPGTAQRFQILVLVCVFTRVSPPFFPSFSLFPSFIRQRIEISPPSPFSFLFFHYIYIYLYATNFTRI